MGSPIFFFLLSLLIFVLADSDLIQKMCQHTNHKDLCASSLKSIPNGTSFDTKSLGLSLMQLGMANATETSSFLLSFQSIGPQDDTVLKGALKECAAKYRDAHDALNSSAQVYAIDDYFHAVMDVSAAQGYPSDCCKVFDTSGLVYPPEIALRESALKNICYVILDIIGFVAGDM